LTVDEALRVVNEPAAAEDPPITVPSIVPPFISIVVTVPKLAQVAPAAVGLVVMIGDTRVLLLKLSAPANVASVPVVGNVTFVDAVVVSVRAFAPEVVKASAKEIVLLFGMVKVPLVSVTVKPATLSALKAWGTAANLTLGLISPSLLNSIPR
jgi:hypothetical protein